MLTCFYKSCMEINVVTIKFSTEEERIAYKMGYHDGRTLGHGEGSNAAMDDCIRILLKRLEKLLNDKSLEWNR